jgi:hypothetical protein
MSLTCGLIVRNHPPYRRAQSCADWARIRPAHLTPTGLYGILPTFVCVPANGQLAVTPVSSGGRWYVVFGYPIAFVP